MATRPALSSIATTLTDLTERVAGTAESLDHGDTEHLAADLYEVERSLRSANRTLSRVLRNLPRA